MTGALPSNPFRASQVHLDPKRAPTIANPAAQKKILAESPKEAFVHLGVHLELPSVVSACNCTMYLASTLNSLPQRDAGPRRQFASIASLVEVTVAVPAPGPVF